jgi:GxxExxY protein
MREIALKRQDAKCAKNAKAAFLSLDEIAAGRRQPRLLATEDGAWYGRPAALRRSSAGLHEPDPQADAVAREVIGAAIDVHRELGPGYPEKVYQNALAEELRERGLAFAREKRFGVRYRGKVVGEGALDFLVAGRVVVELKAVEGLLAVHRAQVLSYLKATKMELGLLINFNTWRLKDEIQRIVRT